MNVFYGGQRLIYDVGDWEVIFNRFSCIKIPNNNKQSFKTFLSTDALLMGLIGMIGNLGSFFIDQSYWQLNSTTSPKKSSISYIVAGLVWMFVSLVN